MTTINFIKKRCADLFGIINIILVLASTSAYAQTTLGPTADTYLRGGTDAGNNFGSVNILAVKKASGAASTRRSYLKFDLSAITAPITGATLKLTVESVNGNNGDTPDNYSVYLVADDSWSEAGLTWNNEPAPLNTTPFPSSEVTVVGVVGPSGAGSILSFDITSAAQQEFAGDKVLSIAIASSGTRYLKFHSKESSGTSPVLEISTGSVSSGISGQPDISTMMGSCDFEGEIPGINAFNATESIQAAGLKYTRIGVFPNEYLVNGNPHPESIDDLVLLLYRKGIQPMLLIEHNPDNGALGNQQKWFDIGQAFAQRFKPNSSFLLQNGISNWGITRYSAINEPLIFLNQNDPLYFPVNDYQNAIKGFADGVHAAQSSLLVAPGGFMEVPLFTNWNPYMSGANGVGALLQNGTLDALDIHRYYDRNSAPYSLINKVASHQVLIDQIKSDHNITTDFRVWCTEYNARQAPNDNDNAKDFVTATWDLLTVRGSDGNIVSDFALAFRTYLPVSSNVNLGMAVSDFPFLGNPKGIAHQMLVNITEGFSMVDADEAAGVDILESGSNKKMWVFHNRNGWSNQVGSTFNITGIPAGANVLEVYRFNSWNALIGSKGSPNPDRTINVSGQSSLTVNQLNTGETYMFVAKPGASSGDMPSVSITSPSLSSTFTEGQTMTITATASDPDGIDEVVIYAGPVRLAELSAPPYTVDWTNIPAGTSKLLAIAKDNNGAVRMAELDVSVEHPSGNNLIVSADAYVKGRQTADTNFGSSPSLLIKDAGNENLQRRIFLKFDLSGLSTVQSAILRLRVANFGNSIHTIYAVPDAEDRWGESTITWNNQPSYPTTITSGNVAPEGQWTDFDITSHINNEIAGNGIASLAIWTSSTSFVEYFSKESGIGNEPRLLITGAQQPETTLNAVADTYSRGGSNANTNYGSNDNLKVKQAGSATYTRRTFVKFDLSTVSSSVSSALLRMRVSRNDGGNGPNNVSFTLVTDDTWQESTLTWNNEPATGLALGTHPSSTPVAVGEWMELDITSAVNQEISGDQQISILVTSDGTGNLDFYSKENAANSPPQLLLNAGSGARKSGNQLDQKASISDNDIVFAVYPNPVRENTIVAYATANTSDIQIAILDIQGKVLKEITEQGKPEGHHTILWGKIAGDQKWQNGVYFLRVSSDNHQMTKRVIISN
ncbi:MAG: DNRLRE domain-containing protein [Cyclobacteriaceae bacterium]|nr:DNRLRE domain-containing protein [Cyclobacteriaceae bacterium HetDA_MAG_MS6]